MVCEENTYRGASATAHPKFLTPGGDCLSAVKYRNGAPAPRSGSAQYSRAPGRAGWRASGCTVSRTRWIKPVNMRSHTSVQAGA